MQGSVDPVYLAAANYLKSIGFTNTAEIARVLDIAMNPNSLFVQYNDAKRSTNVNVSHQVVSRAAGPSSHCAAAMTVTVQFRSQLAAICLSFGSTTQFGCFTSV